MELANTTNFVLSIATVVLQIISILLLIMILTKDKGKVAKWFADKSLALVTLIAGGAMLASLWYSEIIGYRPCLLCWYQRVAMYPIGIIGLTAIIKKQSKEVWSYISVLATLGFMVAVFHVTTRFAKSEIFNCSASGPSCLQDLFKIFNYIDIPVMSLTAFVFVILVIINRRRFS